ncbi:MAG: DUF167 domain-containing protein [Rhizobiales bacterium]|nr:DUF167 domain-containing protein [Hyphomicrobiales bacterium]
MADEPPWAITPSGLALTVRLTPKGGRDAIDGVERLADGRAVLKARVRAAASEGAANAALIRLVAATLGVAPSRVTLTGGATARLKRLRVEGDPSALAAKLAGAASG